jgi:hypothetical protein
MNDCDSNFLIQKKINPQCPVHKKVILSPEQQINRITTTEVRKVAVLSPIKK